MGARTWLSGAQPNRKQDPGARWSKSYRVAAALALGLSTTACGGLEDLGLSSSKPSGFELKAAADHSTDREGGIGGTGIFGSVTELGSIHVNGQDIEIPRDVPVRSVLGVKNGRDLKVGDVVAVSAEFDDDDLIASRVTLFTPLIGPVTDLQPGAGVLAVMGTQVLLEADTAIVDARTNAPIRLDEVQLGQNLVVSGIWRREQVLATRVTRLSGPQIPVISGQISRNGAVARIGGTSLIASDIRENQFATAFGRFVNGGFVAARIDYNPLGVFRAPIETLVVEGVLSQNQSDPGFHLSGFGLPLDPQSPIPRDTETRSLFIGSFSDGFLIERSAPLPNTTAERREMLGPH
ncbi:MAG: hypothetical protein KTR21_06305 [Rhodobacteraceae bacterium]|nr:hypothetical protein [Paracoccaceae bacterium]